MLNFLGISDDSTHFNASNNAVHISVPRRNTDSGYLNPIQRAYVNEDTVIGQNDNEEIHHITNNPTYVNSGMDATEPGVETITPVQPSEQQDSGYERLRRVIGTHNLSGWLKQHKTLAVVVLAILVTMAITSGIIVAVMMAVTKENTVVVKQDADKRESSPSTTLLVT